jgi:hypothetical protein
MTAAPPLTQLMIQTLLKFAVGLAILSAVIFFGLIVYVISTMGI